MAQRQQDEPREPRMMSPAEFHQVLQRIRDLKAGRLYSHIFADRLSAFGTAGDIVGAVSGLGAVNAARKAGPRLFAAAGFGTDGAGALFSIRDRITGRGDTSGLPGGIGAWSSATGLGIGAAAMGKYGVDKSGMFGAVLDAAGLGSSIGEEVFRNRGRGFSLEQMVLEAQLEGGRASARPVQSW
jgi:hypothetical protein